MKKRFAVITAVVLALMLAACGSARNSAATPEMAPAPAAAEYKAAADYDAGYTMGNYPMEEAMAEEAGYANDATSASMAGSGASVAEKAYNGEVKLIYRADVSAETTQIDQAIADLEALADSMGGYVEYSDIGNYSYGGSFDKYANYTIRIPSEKYEAFLTSLNASGSCTVRSISKSTEDVGAQYADTEARLKTLRIKQERMQELLSQAENMEDIIALENALTDVEYQIEWNSSTLNRYDALVNFSTVNVYLQQVLRETQVSESGSLGERIVNAFHNGISAFKTGFENFMIFIAGAIIPLLIVIAVIVIIVLLVRRAVNRGNRKEKANKKKKAGEESRPEE